MTDAPPPPITGRNLPIVGEVIPEHPNLGAPVASYPSRRGLWLTLGATVLIPLGVLLGLTLVPRPEPWAGPLAAVITGTLTWAIGWAGIHYWNKELVLYTGGFTFREGSADVPFLYAEVTGVRWQAQQLSYFFGLVRRTAQTIRIDTVGGDSVVLRGLLYRRLDDLGPRLLAATTPVLRPVVRARLNQGQPVAFGDLTLSADGLTLAGAQTASGAPASLAWTAYRRYAVQRGKLHLYGSDGTGEGVWAAVPLAALANLPLLLEVLGDR